MSGTCASSSDISSSGSYNVDRYCGAVSKIAMIHSASCSGVSSCRPHLPARSSTVALSCLECLRRSVTEIFGVLLSFVSCTGIHNGLNLLIVIRRVGQDLKGWGCCAVKLLCVESFASIAQLRWQHGCIANRWQHGSTGGSWWHGW